MIFIVVRHPIRPEYAGEFPRIVAEFTAATRAEPGNISFEWSRSTDDPATYFLIEAFRDAAAGQAHVNLPSQESGAVERDIGAREV
jgi:quinol monooxygenase YgiN